MGECGERSYLNSDEGSHFWIITEFSDMETATAYQAWTLATLVLGVSSIVWIVVLRNAAGLVL
ncbi:hypothetical protein [Haloarcula laminariae]|uniref:hypothetical protein n=1 Tax=Haloarcula laminariae TaxID=2961577 RepID=UPI0021C916AF|nr:MULTISPECIES: hypothetical protein [Halomicroarcula]